MTDPEQQSALALTKGQTPTPANIARVGRECGEELARWAFTQQELRVRASAKFSRADEMLFVREALEQASSERVAEYHASLFPSEVLVADLTTGIGGDLIALARRGPAIGFELDSERAQMARHNLDAVGLRVDVRLEDSLSAAWEWEYAFADPTRRVAGRRTLDPAEFSPDPTDLANRFGGLQLGIMKLSPLLLDSFLSALGPSLRFVSCDGECREALVASGKQAQRERLAVHIESGEVLEAGNDAPCTETMSELFYDADPSAVRAHCLGTLAARYGLFALGNSRGYLTGNVVVATPWLRAYRVLYTGSADVAKTKRQLHALGAATPEIKQRHAGLSQEHLTKTFRSVGKRRVSLAIWPVGRSLRHTILEDCR